VTSYLSRERGAFRRIFGENALEAGILTVTLDTYRDIRLLPPHIKELVGFSRAASLPEQRFFKRFSAGHWTAFPEAYPDVLGYCSARAAAYLVEALAPIGISVRVVSDAEVSSEWSGTFVNIGSSASNIKTHDIKMGADNFWLSGDVEKFVFKDGHEEKSEDHLDKGVILKLPNPHFRGYSVMVCAGLGEWGTSGAGRFLAREWRGLARRFGKNPFLMMVGVTPGADESCHELFALGKETLLWRIASRIRSDQKRARPFKPQAHSEPSTREWSLE
jgi:hypothetical protein